MTKYPKFIVPSIVIAVAVVTLVGTGTVPRRPVVKSFEVTPENTCSTNPTNPTVQWSTDGDSVDIAVIAPSGDVLAERTGLPASSGTDTSPFVDLRSVSVRPGKHTVRLTAKFTSGTTTEESRPFRLVGEQGIPYELSLGASCSADACESFGPAEYKVRPSELDSTVTFSEVSLDGFNSTVTTRLFAMDISKPGGGVSLCSGYEDCSRLPSARRPVPSAWNQTPQGTYEFVGITDRVPKTATFTWTASFNLVCRR